MSSSAGESVLNGGKELDPLTTTQSEELGGSETDRLKDAVCSKIMHITDDIKGAREFLTIPRQQLSFLDTQGLVTDVPSSQDRLESTWSSLTERLTALQDELPGRKTATIPTKQEVLLGAVSEFDSWSSETIEQSESLSFEKEACTG